jgi:hypothetical protein
MGFRVEISDEDDRLLRRLAREPSAIFPAPYNGYLLFLIGGADRAALDWLSANIVTLDSLTGQDVAFAVFAERLEFKVFTGGRDPSAGRSPRTVGTIDSRELSGGREAVSALVKRGRCGFVVDQDTIAAVTYATDIVARNLGVIDSLPCVLAIDGLPLDRSAKVIKLTDAVIPQFIPLLRSAIASFTQEPGYAGLNGEIRHALRTQEQLEQIDRQEEVIRTQLDSFRGKLAWLKGLEDPDLDTRQLRERIHRAREALLNGSLKRFRAAFATARPSEHGGSPGLDREYIDNILNVLRGPALRHATIVNTINTLTYYAGSLPWPLAGEWVGRYRHICDAYVSKLLADDVVCDPTSVHQCRDVLDRLDKARRESVAAIDGALPSASDIRTTILDRRQRWHEEAIKGCEAEVALKESELARLPSILPLQRAEAESRLAAWARGMTERLPSFTAHVRAAMRTQKLEQYASVTKSGVANFLANLFKPELLFKIGQWMAGAAH